MALSSVPKLALVLGGHDAQACPQRMDGHKEVIEALIEAGADTNTRSKQYGAPPLTYETRYKQRSPSFIAGKSFTGRRKGSGLAKNCRNFVHEFHICHSRNISCMRPTLSTCQICLLKPQKSTSSCLPVTKQQNTVRCAQQKQRHTPGTSNPASYRPTLSTIHTS